IFTAPIQDPAVTENNQGIFRLKREVYNGVTGKQSPLLVLCKYPLQTRYNNVAEATTRQPIFSVGGELATLQKSAFILCETIEQEELERIAEKFNSHPTSTNNLHRNSSQKPPCNPSTKPMQSNTTPNQTRIDQLRATLEQVKASGSSSKQNSYNICTEEQIDKGKRPATFNTNININSEYIPSNNDPNTPCKTSPLIQESSEPSNFNE
ncbi:20313_t:CDS:2, partial [Gigaspora margarita]